MSGKLFIRKKIQGYIHIYNFFQQKNDINHDDGFYIQPSLSPFSTKKFEKNA